jgi:hypothetical protein
VNRSDVAARVAAVRRLLAAAERVHEDRARLVAALLGATGLSREGVEVGFGSLEREAPEADLRALVEAAGDASHVHVILSANVFVAPLRAIALARAAAPRVTVRPSSRDPVLAEALVARAGDPAIAIVQGEAIPDGADRVDVYGRDETIAAVRAGARAGLAVRGHGAGLGLAFVRAADPLDEAAAAIAADVIPFDQRGCLSPRVVLVEGSAGRGIALAERLDASLAAWSLRVPRGALTADERAEAARWRDAIVFAGRVWDAPDHATAHVALPPEGDPLAPTAVPPPGRHVLVITAGDPAALAPIAPFVVTVGLLHGGEAHEVTPAVAALVERGARVSRLGAMQRPPLDGPVDRRSIRAGI